MDIKITRHGLLWDASAFDHFLFANDYEVDGLNNHYSTFGLGVPLIAVSEEPRPEEGEGKFYPPKHSFPVTAFLRMDCDIRGLRNGGYRKATLELYDPLRVQSTRVAGKEVPLESDLTTPLGYYLAQAKYEKFELSGLLRVESVQDRAGLYMLQPYEKGKIPVVMVHGLWSSPLAWMQMFNDLRGDPEIRDRYQFWFFMYPTGNPILYSASMLRSELKEVINTVDPNGEDPAIQQMVLVGHSMGGLLSKLMVQDSQEELWQVVSKKPFDRIEADPADRAKIRQAFFFEKQPFVSRIIFIAVPHRGSTLSDGFVGRLSSRLIALPKGLLDTKDKLLAKNPDAFASALEIGLPTSVDNLSPESPIIQAVGRLPIATEVKYHSIIGNAKEGVELRDSTDGVVPYSSSHVPNAVSEYIVSAGHACQSHPLTVLEVRRILHQHLRDIKEAAPVRLADRLLYPTDVKTDEVPALTK
jgi:pimeloyl-ACP methyl ester carboxylesterase